jgi:hypothetical protein
MVDGQTASVNLPTRKVPALTAVQTAKTTLAESLTKIPPRFSTAFSTVVLKTFLDLHPLRFCANAKAAQAGGSRRTLLSNNFQQ